LPPWESKAGGSMGAAGTWFHYPTLKAGGLAPHPPPKKKKKKKKNNNTKPQKLNKKVNTPPNPPPLFVFPRPFSLFPRRGEWGWRGGGEGGWAGRWH